MIEDISDNIPSNNSNIEITDSNKIIITESDIENRIECPVCLYNIEECEGILIMECCKKMIHLTCIIDWYTKNPQNTICFMCNQSNKFCKDLYYNIQQGTNNNTNIEMNPNDNQDDNPNDNSEIFNNSNNYIYKTCILKLFIIVICVTICLIIIFNI